MEAIIRWHPFADGNKRTALLAVSTYLDINNYTLCVPLSAVRFTVLIAKNNSTDQKSIDKLIKEIARWIRKYSARKDDHEQISKVLKSVRREYVLLQALGQSYVLRKLAEFSVKRYLAIDIYPEYAAETQNIVAFLGDLIRRNIEQSREK